MIPEGDAAGRVRHGTRSSVASPAECLAILTKVLQGALDDSPKLRLNLGDRTTLLR
jgi:hypothetical protein